jgi:nitrite reductase (NADH) large subunit
MAKETKYVVIGGGIAGISAAEAIRKQDPEAKIRLFSREKLAPYSRMALTRYMAGEVDREKLPLHPRDWYLEKQVALEVDQPVVRIDPSKQELHLQDGRVIQYDKLVLATGADPFVPPFPGKDLESVIAVRTLEDADFVLDCCKQPIDVVCIGGGLLGLELAGAIAQGGARVTVIETFDWLLPRQLDPQGGKLLQSKIEAMGMQVVSGGKTKTILGDEKGHARGVQLEDGRELPAQLVLVSTGVRPNLDLAKTAGLAINKGILVDDRMASNDPLIFAAGDNTEHKGVLYGLWLPAKTQGSVAGTNAAGGDARFEGMAPSAMLKVLGIDLFSIGKISGDGQGEKVLQREQSGNYCSYILQEGKLLGAILLGDAKLSGKVKKAMDSGRVFTEESNLEAFEQELKG